MIEKIKSIIHSGPKTALAVLALIVVWMLLGLIFGSNDAELNTEAHNEKGKLNEVLVKQSHAQAIHREISILGETRYSRSVVITALVDGTVTKISGKEGQLIHKNDNIIYLDKREALAEYKQAEALEKQKHLEFEGYQKLFNDELISAAKFAQAKSELESAKAQKVKKQIQLESTTLKPPFEGVLQKILVEQGDYVRVGQDVAEILDFSPFVVRGSVSEKEAVYIDQGMNADARLIDGSVFHGLISYKSTKADEQSRSFLLEMTVNNENNDNILSGISATITIPVTHSKAHNIASSSLEIDENGKFGVKTINDDHLVSFQNVEIVKSGNEGVWVSGLPDKVNIIIRGQGFVKSGDIVNPVFEQINNEMTDTPESTLEGQSSIQTDPSLNKIKASQTDDENGQDS